MIVSKLASLKQFKTKDTNPEGAQHQMRHEEAGAKWG